MSQAVRTKETATLLQAIYKNVKMASDSILNLMPKVKDPKLKNDLTVQLSVYEAYSSRAAKLLADEGVKPEDESTVTKLASKWGTMMNTMMDSTDSHIAQLIAEGSTMGITDGIKLLRDYENTGVSEGALKLVREVIEFEENNLERAKKYI